MMVAASLKERPPYFGRGKGERIANRDGGEIWRALGIPRQIP